jgi:hypothetical protein
MEVFDRHVGFSEMPWYIVLAALAQIVLYLSIAMFFLAAARAMKQCERWLRSRLPAPPRSVAGPSRMGRPRPSPRADGGPREYAGTDYPSVGPVNLTPEDAEEP